MVVALVETIGANLFAGKRPDLIAAVLAELMATFLVNHKIPADLARQEKLREEILTEWCDTVRALVAVVENPPPTETIQ